MTKKEYSPVLIGMGWFTYQKGGLNKYFSDLVDIMEKNIRTFKALAGHKRNQQLSDKRYSFKMDVSLLKRFYNIKVQMDSILREFQPNIMNFHFALTAFPILKDKRIFSLPKVFNFQGPWAYEGLVENNNYKGVLISKAKFLMEKYVYSQMDKFIVLSNAFKRILIEKYKIHSEKIDVIPPGVDMVKFAPLNMDKKELRKLMRVPQDRFVIFTVRRLVRRMGLFNLLSAISLLKQHNQEIFLIIGGKGYLYHDLKRFIEEYELTNYVKLLGFVDNDDLIKYYNLADLTIMPTEALEGFGLVTLESLSCGTPVMATPVDANLESVGNFNKRLLFSDKTPEAIAEGVIEVLNGRTKLPTREECRKYVMRNFSWDIIFQRIIESWEELL